MRRMQMRSANEMAVSTGVSDLWHETLQGPFDYTYPPIDMCNFMSRARKKGLWS